MSQVITLSETRLIGLNLGTGALLWERPFTTPFAQNAITPVVEGDVVVYSGLDRGVNAARLVQGEDSWRLETLLLPLFSERRPDATRRIRCALSSPATAKRR